MVWNRVWCDIPGCIRAVRCLELLCVPGEGVDKLSILNTDIRYYDGFTHVGLPTSRWSHNTVFHKYINASALTLGGVLTE